MLHSISIFYGLKNKYRIPYLFLFFFSFCFLGSAQEITKSETYYSLDPSEIAKLKNFDFHENFAVFLKTDNSSNYFFLDISKLPSVFAFKYFLYLITESGNRIQTGHGIQYNRAWFISGNKISATLAMKQILSLKEKAIDKNRRLSEEEKTDWIKSNNY